MKMKEIFIILFSILFCANVIAQQKQIVWQGKLLLKGSSAKEMSMRLELVIEGGNCIGVLYTRASDKGSVFGCDYIVSGVNVNNYFNLQQIKVIRSVSINHSGCNEFEKLALSYQSNDSSMSLSGQWIWKSGELVKVNLLKIEDEISESALDEISGYRTELFKLYEEKSVYLPAAARMKHVVKQIEVDSTDLVVDITGATSGAGDSLQAFLNGEPITNSHAISVGQLRIRIKSLAIGENELTIVNTSAITSKLFLSIGFTQKGKKTTEGVEATFVRNPIFLLRRPN
jgi:hypothetical protein